MWYDVDMENLEKKRRGAPKKLPENRGIYVGIRLTPARKLKFKELGGSFWLSKIIDKSVA